jgi:hypothetical protein
MAPERRTERLAVVGLMVGLRAVQVGLAGQFWLGAEAAIAAAAKRAWVYRMRGDRPVVGEGNREPGSGF